MKLICWIFGHKRNIEDMGGAIYEVCDRCNWTGKHIEYPIQYTEHIKVTADLGRKT